MWLFWGSYTTVNFSFNRYSGGFSSNRWSINVTFLTVLSCQVIADHLHNHHRSMTSPRPNHCFSSRWALVNHSLNLLLSTETWSGFLGWWQGSMTKPAKVLQNTTTCSSWSQEALSTWVFTTYSMFSVFWRWSSLSYHHLCAVERILSIKSCLQHISVVTWTDKPTHKSLHSFVMHSSSTGCWDSFVDPDFADCLSNESMKQGDSSLQLQSGRWLRQSCTHYRVESGTMNQFGRLLQFPSCQLFFCLLLDKTCIQTSSFRVGYFVWGYSTEVLLEQGLADGAVY